MRLKVSRLIALFAWVKFWALQPLIGWKQRWEQWSFFSFCLLSQTCFRACNLLQNDFKDDIKFSEKSSSSTLNRSLKFQTAEKITQRRKSITHFKMKFAMGKNSMVNGHSYLTKQNTIKWLTNDINKQIELPGRWGVVLTLFSTREQTIWKFK